MRLRHVIAAMIVVGACGNEPSAPDGGSDAVSGDATADALDAPAAPPVCTALSELAVPSRAYAIDAAGHIAGAHRAANGETHAFRWDGISAAPIDLGTLGGGFSVAYGISGQFTVGVFNVPGSEQGFVSDTSGMRELVGPAGSGRVSVYGVNASGIAVGDATLAGGVVHAMKYENGAAIDLGTLPGDTSSTATAINDSGVIVGISGGTAVKWINGVISALGPGGAVAINSAGDTAAGGLHQYRGGVAKELELPGGLGLCIPDPTGSVFGVNDAGWIVGYAHCPAGARGPGEDTASLYIDGSPWNLSGLLTPPGYGGPSFYASAVNNTGQIAATRGRYLSRLGTAVMRITCVAAP